MKKIIALVLALAMVMTCAAAFAANDPDPDRSRSGWDDTKNPGWTGVPDGSIGLSGLKPGDQVNFYRVLEYNQDATGGVMNVVDDNGEIIATYPAAGSWKVTEQFKSAVSEADLATILSTGIDATLAGKIGKNAKGTTSIKATADENGNATYTGPGAGLYVAIITPAIAGMMYNPVFVSSDYYTTKDGDLSSAWQVTDALSYSNGAMAKVTTIDLTKEATLQTDNRDNQVETVGVGDTVSFEVKTTIPEFADNYTKAVFKVSDTLSEGLKLLPGTLSVATTGDSEDAIPSTAYDEPTTSDSGFTVNFKTSYLLGLSEALPITITYKALVTSDAVTSVNILDNTVTVNFSNHPEDGEGKGVLKDETKHYTFDIDAELLGPDTWQTIEVVKIGVDKNGNEITKKEVRSGSSYGALKGAEFELQNADGTRYSNDWYGENDVIVSDDNGLLTVKGASVAGIRGLDAGTYKLVETKAPDGYIRAQQPVTIVIDAHMKPNPTKYTETINGIEVSWEVKELDYYTITIDGKQTAKYTMNNNEEPDHGDNVVGTATGGDNGKIKNTQGVELPSTGGIGTTIFYILGGLLVVGAAVILVARRKAQD